MTEKWKHLQQLPGEVNPVRNSSRYDSKPSGALDPAGIILECNPATGGTAEQQGIISNGVNIISYCVLDGAHHRPVRGVEILDFKMKSDITALL
ncbi:MAG: hypothetical protein ABSG71_21540 [Thermodesulfobacteriota bacterium]